MPRRMEKKHYRTSMKQSARWCCQGGDLSSPLSEASTSAGTSSTSMSYEEGEPVQRMDFFMYQQSGRGNPEVDDEYWFWRPLYIKNTFIAVPTSRVSGSAAMREAQSCMARFHTVETVTAPAAVPPPPPPVAPKQAVRRTSKSRMDLEVQEKQRKSYHPLPSVGSAGHAAGTCKPCAFFHTKGCRHGTQCEFCHLCDEGEKKRRRRDKVALLRAVRMAVDDEDYYYYR
eukprot:CAMPEP_0178438082 /NCGR_PEP_ID=MMETSP0689_2-20121128/35373_1 /TAXON_ID=160604 /ORGANISM="Amphidinium massartii, Strain CS-259" /LENGTH=227 /DNA_ID=CAMNT_0020060401 /DNA_START=78 /DNA_END=761 /DNA_ORIENTATION=+